VDVAEDNTADTRTLGQLFAAERERQGLSRVEAAQRLHMSAWQIEALEGGDYSRLPQGTFLRGFVRNYAKALALDSNAMLERLTQSAPPGSLPRIVVPSQNIRFDPLGERLANPYIKAGGLAVAFIAFGFAAMYWWLFIRPSPPANAAKKFVETEPMNLAAAPVTPPEPVVARPLSVEPARSEPPKVELPKVEAPKAEPPKPEAAKKPEPPKPEVAKKAEPPKPEAAKKPEPPKAPEIVKVSAPLSDPSLARTLKLRFKGASWVEIKDRSGKVLLSRVNSPGSQAEVSGRPPFNVVIGNAPEVQVLYEDREFPLEPHTRVAVARFTVE
jgi:cytoskeleton protein RodZ